MQVMPRAAQVALCVSIFVFLSPRVCWSDNPPDVPEELSKRVATLLSKNCVACHNAKKAEGGLNLESHETMMRGGDTGAVVSLERPSESLLLARVLGEDESLMPPEDNAVDALRLTESEIELLLQWIQNGAKFPSGSSMPAIQWKKIPAEFTPVYAMSASSDGNYLAFGRANEVAVVANAAGPQPRFQSLIDPSLAIQATPVLAAHLDLVQSIAFSPDGQRIATGGYRSAKIWKRKTTAEVLLSGLAHTDGPMAMTRDGLRMACANSNGSIDLVDVARQRSHRLLSVHPAAVVALAWWQAGEVLISMDSAGNLRQTTWDGLATVPVEVESPVQVTSLVSAANRLFLLDQAGQVSELRAADTTENAPPSLVLYPLEGLANVQTLTARGGESATIAFVRSDRSIEVVRIDTLERISQIKQEDPVQYLALSNDASLVAAVDDRGSSRIWRTQDSGLIATLNQDYVYAQQLLVAQRDVDRQQAWLAELDKQLPGLKSAAEKEVEAKNKVQEVRDKAVAALAENVSANETAMAGVAGSEKSLVDARQALEEAMKRVETLVAEVDNKKKLVVETETKKKAAEDEVSKREQALATANESSERAAAQIPMHETKIAAEREVLVEFQGMLSSLKDAPQPVTARSLAFSNDDAALILLGMDQPVRIFESQTGRPIANLVNEFDLPDFASITDSNQLVSLGGDGTLRSWDLNMPWALERAIGSASEALLSDRVTALDFSPDGRLLAIGSGPPSRFGDMKVFEVASGDLIADFGQVHSDTVLSLRFAPDGRHIATAGADRLCRMFDTLTQQLVRSFEGHTHHILSVAWKDDGQTLATASADATVKIWNVATGEQKRTITGFAKEVTSLQFVGQTPRIVTADAAGQVRIHNSDDGKQERALTGATNALYASALSADNLSVSAGGQAGSVWMWSLADGKLLTTLPKNSTEK